MRELDIGSKRFTTVRVLDQPGAGNACHEYDVVTASGVAIGEPLPVHGKVSFQNGPIQEAGVNGLHQEDLLAIVIDRLRSFQAGEFRCRENAIALTKIEEAMLWLNKRTAERQAQGVEGKNEAHKEV